jgi:hypothetical protein
MAYLSNKSLFSKIRLTKKNYNTIVCFLLYFLGTKQLALGEIDVMEYTNKE